MMFFFYAITFQIKTYSILRFIYSVASWNRSIPCHWQITRWIWPICVQFECRIQENGQGRIAWRRQYSHASIGSISWMVGQTSAHQEMSHGCGVFAAFFAYQEILGAGRMRNAWKVSHHPSIVSAMVPKARYRRQRIGGNHWQWLFGAVARTWSVWAPIDSYLRW